MKQLLDRRRFLRKVWKNAPELVTPWSNSNCRTLGSRPESLAKSLRTGSAGAGVVMVRRFLGFDGSWLLRCLFSLRRNW